jgi:ribonuclease HII
VSLNPDDTFECEAWTRGFRRVAGLDEAGRGPLAGPVVAAAVVLPRRCRLQGLRDAKLLSERQRDCLYTSLLTVAVDVGVGVVDAELIDALNILEATRLAMCQAIRHLSPPPDYLLLDAVVLPGVPTEQRAVIKGDRLCLSVAAASVVAKVLRDRLMVRAHAQYPQYGFLLHKGYGTAEHLRQLQRHGPCALHRRSFRPVLELETDAR